MKFETSCGVWYAIAIAMASSAAYPETQIDWRRAVVAQETPVEVLNDPGGWFAPISVDFPDVPLNEVVTALAGHMQRNIAIDPQIGSQRVTLIAHHPIPRYQARALLESVLHSRGYALVENIGGVILEIRQLGQAIDKLDIVVQRNETHGDVVHANEPFAANEGVLRVGMAYLALGDEHAVWAGSPGALGIVESGVVSAGKADFGSAEVIAEGETIRVNGVEVTKGWIAVGAPSDDGFTILLIRRAPIDRATQPADREVGASDAR
jgi:hypothetical protein